MPGNRVLSLTKQLIFLLLLSLAAVAGAAEKSVIIGFHSTVGDSERQLIRNKGGTIQRELGLIHALVVTIPETALPELDTHPKIKFTEHNQQVRFPFPPHENKLQETVAASIDEYQQNRSLQQISVDKAHSKGITGAGVKIAIIDTGIDYNHQELKDNYRGGYDFVNDDADPMDDSTPGHGTQVAGIIAARLDDQGIVGVAPDASIYALKVMDRNGSSSISNIVAALQWTVDNKIDVVNISMGGPGGTSLKEACNAAFQAGVLIVAATGNSERGGVDYPAAYDSVIAVGATDQQDNPEIYTAQGNEVELAAPGTAIYSTKQENNYGTISGTSLAAPHITGVAALILSAGVDDINNDGVADNRDVRLKLLKASRDLGKPGRDDLYGYGIIDVNGIFDPRQIQLPDLSLTLQDDMEPVLPGDQFNYSITVQNIGTAEALHTKLLLTLPPSITLLGDNCFSADTENTGEGENTTRLLTCKLGSIPKEGGLRTVNVSARLSPDSRSGVISKALATTYLERNAADNAAQESTTTINRPPTTGEIALDAVTNTPAQIDNLLDTASDPDNDTLGIVGADSTSRAGGTVVHHSDDSFTYTPPTNFTGSDSFSYLVSDEHNEPVSGIITIKVKAVLTIDIESNPNPAFPDDEITYTISITNQTPVNAQNVSIALNSLQGSAAIELLSLDSNCQQTEAQLIMYCDIGDIKKNGGVKRVQFKARAVAATTLHLQADIAERNDLFLGRAQQETVTRPPNHNPVVQDDKVTTGKNTPLAITTALANDSDPDGDALHIESVDETSDNGGNVLLSGDAGITYTPPDEFSGEDRFKYSITDGNGGTATGTIIVIVTGDTKTAQTPSTPAEHDSISEPGGGASGIITLLLLLLFLAGQVPIRS